LEIDHQNIDDIDLQRRKMAADNAGSRQRRQCALQSKGFGGNEALAENTRKAGGGKVQLDRARVQKGDGMHDADSQ
jgi:hypothetical protein